MRFAIKLMKNTRLSRVSLDHPHPSSSGRPPMYAHSSGSRMLGVLGKGEQGTAEHFGLENERALILFFFCSSFIFLVYDFFAPVTLTASNSPFSGTSSIHRFGLRTNNSGPKDSFILRGRGLTKGNR